MFYKIKYSYIIFLIRLNDKKTDEYLQKLSEAVSDSSKFSDIGDESYVPRKLRKNADPKEFSDNEYYGM